MLIKHMAACLLATSLVAAPALAQTATGDRPAASDNRTGTLGSPTMNAPGTTAPSGSSSTMGSSSTTAQAPAPAPATPPAGGASMAGGSGMTQLQQGQFMASDLIGTRVVGQNNEAIGDVNDVVMGPDGKAMAILVGVGGFLGIGEKDVAIPFDQAKVMFDNNDRSSNASGSTGAPNTTGSTAGGTAGSTAGGGMGASGGNTAATNASAAANEPQRIVINMTKEQLQQAPAFRTSGGSDNAAGGSSGSSTAPAGGNTAPRQ
jgi:sporulation protein YlmC with PRC-barrel domain